ncbi:MAG: BlaI/MecI/CopY family transcriptional regulator, partial [Phycisphaerales bacterium]
EAEWEVMRTLWARSPLTANKVVEALSVTRPWKPKTIKTLLSRLVKKKAVGFERKSREYDYYPLVTEAQCVGAENSSFLRRVYGGAAKPMLAAFIENEHLSRDDVEELRRILDKKGNA